MGGIKMNKSFLSNLNQCNIPYSLETVDCFERAFSICLDSLKPGYANIFLLLNAYDKCYGPLFGHEDDIFMQKIKFIDYYMNIGVQKIITSKNIISILEYFLSQNCPVIVPINLRYLFYSDKYLEEDWPHPFIIKGFNSKKKIFYILDNTQMRSVEISESDFSIEYDLLVKVFNAYFSRIETHQSPFILVFEEKKAEKYLDEVMIFKKFIQDIDMKKIECIEFKILKGLYLEHETNILNYPKYKDLLFTLIFKYLKLLDIDICAHDFENMRDDIVNLWLIIVRRSYKNLLKNGIFSLEDSKVKEIDYMEKKLWMELHDLLIQTDIDTLSFQQHLHSKVRFENNDDGIITGTLDKYCFNFSGEKLYNSWFDDKSPKVVMVSGNEFSLKTNVEVNTNGVDVYFVSGLFIRDFDNLYYFGLDSNRRINLDKANKISSIKEVIQNLSKLGLEIKFSNRLCKLYYVTNETKRLFYEFNTESDTIECGIGCKTYESAKPIVATFEIL